MTTKEVLTSVRALIGDINSDKWSLPQTLDALNNTRTELVRRSGVLKASGVIQLTSGKSLFKLPEDCFYLIRAFYKGEKIELISMSELDEIDSNWIDANESEYLKYIIYDNLNQNEVMIYPQLSKSSVIDNYKVIGKFGAITDIDSIDTSVLYGAITDITDTSDHTVTREDNYGVLTDVNDTLSLPIYYVKKPTELTSIDQDIEIDGIYKMYLVYKTAAELLSYDNNVDNMNKSITFDKKAEYQIRDIKSDNASDYSNGKGITFGYRGAFDE